MTNEVSRNDFGDTVPAFWTVALHPPHYQSVDLTNKTAVQRLIRLKAYDWGTASNNDIKTTVPAIITSTTSWSGLIKTETVDNNTNKYKGDPIIVDTATFEWTLFEPKTQPKLRELGFFSHFRFVADSAGQTCHYAHIGFESNGSFYS